MATTMTVAPMVLRRPIVIPSGRRTIVLRLSIPARVLLLLLLAAPTTTQQPAKQSSAKQSSARAAVLVAIAVVVIIVIVLQLRLDHVGGDCSCDSAHDLAELAAA